MRIFPNLANNEVSDTGCVKINKIFSDLILSTEDDSSMPGAHSPEQTVVTLLWMKTVQVVGVLSAVHPQLVLELEVFLSDGRQSHGYLTRTGDLKDVHRGSLHD